MPYTSKWSFLVGLFEFLFAFCTNRLDSVVWLRPYHSSNAKKRSKQEHQSFTRARAEHRELREDRLCNGGSDRYPNRGREHWPALAEVDLLVTHTGTCRFVEFGFDSRTV
jgi:hypothetical protein